MSSQTPPPPPTAYPTPPPPAPPEGAYPVRFDFDPPERVARWRPLIAWLLVVPHFILLYVLGLVAGILVFVAWLCGVFAGKVPEGIQGFIAMYLRYTARVGTYALFLHGDYPPFDFTSSIREQGSERTRVDFTPAVAGRSRLTIFFRGLLAIPHFIAIVFVGIAFYVVVVIAWFAVIFLGRWPIGLRNLAVGMLRWNTRLNGYVYLLTDEYPPFSLN